MKDSGQTLFIDDADSLVGSKGGNEDCAGLLKAALDGDDNDDKGSEIAWRTQVKILDDDGLEIPKHFYYRGNIVIATNFLLGNIETAIRIKCYTQEMVFSTKEIIEYIRENILDKTTTTRGGEIPKTIKLQVIDYFDELAETSDFKLNVRTFQTCCEIAICEENWDDAKEVMKEQLENVSTETKGKY